MRDNVESGLPSETLSQENSLGEYWGQLNLIPGEYSVMKDLHEIVSGDDLGYAESLLEIDSVDYRTEDRFGWGMVRCPEGQYPSITLYNNLKDLVSALAKLEGADTSVFLFYGVGLTLTTPCVASDTELKRFLVLPGRKCVEVRKGNSEVVEWENLPKGCRIQEEGWLGSPIREDYQVLKSDGRCRK